MGNETIIAYATIALVIITAVYAVLTWRMVREMVRGRKHGLMPIITCRITSDMERNRKAGMLGTFNNVLVRNAGNAPAIDTIVLLDATNPSESTLKFASKKWMLGILGMDETGVSLSVDKPAFQTTPSNPKVAINITYQNIYGVRFETKATFEFVVHDVKPPEPSATCEWVKISEQVLSPAD